MVATCPIYKFAVRLRLWGKVEEADLTIIWLFDKIFHYYFVIFWHTPIANAKLQLYSQEQ
jgi:hypothetical protein